MPISLYPHNQAAYAAAIAMLAKTGKAAIIHPTGTGKSFIGFKLCEDNPDKTICWLSPSEYIFKTQLENLKKVMSAVPQNIRFLTYAKLMLMDDRAIEEIRPDFIVLDEFHRCGAEQWGEGVRSLLRHYPHIPLLGLTATNVRYLDGQRDMAAELFNGSIASQMTLGEAIVRGILTPPRYVLSVFSYQKDLEKYRRRVENARGKASYVSAAKYYEAIRRKLENAEGLEDIFERHMTDRSGKYLVFCSNAGHMDEMIAKADKWFRKVDPNPEIYRVLADDPSTDKAFAAFKKSDSRHLKLLYCIDMLNEGVHLSDISGVILLRPTISPIIYKQQIGRALAAGAGKDAVILDIVLNIQSLYSIGTIQEEMRAAITYYQYLGQYKNIVNDTFEVIDETRDCKTLFAELERALSASWDIMYAEARAYYESRGDLLIPAKYKTETGLSLGSWLNVQRKIYNGKAEGFLTEEQIARLDAIGIVWDSYRDLSWERSFLEAKAYYKAHGNLLVPARYVTASGFPLGIWITRMRAAKSNRRTGLLTEERARKLDEIGMSWDALSDQWERNFAEAEKYYKEHGNLLVPARYVTASGLKLGNWIAHLRRKRAQKTTPQNSIFPEGSRPEPGGGFAEDQSSQPGPLFEEDHRSEPGGVHTEASGSQPGPLFTKAHRPEPGDALTEDQIRRLDSIGMAWNADEERWSLGLTAARRYSQEHGSLAVPISYETDDGFRLGAWISQKRRQYKKGALTEHQIAELEQLGMRWEAHEGRWWEMYAEARSYYETHGHLAVPRAYQTANGHNLSLWLARMKREPEKLTEDQIEALADVGLTSPNRPSLAAG